MIGRQQRCQGTDLMDYTRWYAFDVEHCFCKLLRCLLQMKSSVSRVFRGDELGEIEVPPRENDEAFGPVAHAVELVQRPARAR